MTKVRVKKLNTLEGHTDCVYTVQAGGTSNIFFSGAGDGMVVQWDLAKPETGQLIARLPNSVYAVHYLDANDALVVGNNFQGIHLLDWRTKKELGSLALGSAPIFDIQSWGRLLYVASGTGTLTAVDVDAWAARKKVTCSDKSLRALAINPRQGEIAAGYSDWTIRVFELETLQLKYEWTAHENSVFTLAYSSDFKILLSGSRDARLRSWDASHGYSPVGDVVAHLYALNHIACSPDGKHFVTCSLDKSIKVWDMEEMRLVKVIDKARHAGHGTSVNKLLWTSFDGQVVSASDDRTLRIWDIIFE